MDSRDEIEARLRKRLHASPQPPMEVTRSFLRAYCSDADSVEEVREEVGRTAAVNPRPIAAALDAIELLLADPPRDGSVAIMVAVDGNRSLDDPSDAGALVYLRRIAGVLRDALGRGGTEGPHG